MIAAYRQFDTIGWEFRDDRRFAFGAIRRWVFAPGQRCDRDSPAHGSFPQHAAIQHSKNATERAPREA
jgi:hypothetical protein